MASFAEESRRALGTEWQKRVEARAGAASAKEMAEWHCWCALVDLQLIMKCSEQSGAQSAAS
jgi:hypothetical protein